MKKHIFNRYIGKWDKHYPFGTSNKLLRWLRDKEQGFWFRVKMFNEDRLGIKP